MAVKRLPAALLAVLGATFVANAHAAPQNILVYPSSGVQGVPIAGYIGSFTASESNATAASFVATVDWGNGDVSPTLIEESPFPGLFTVTAPYTYRTPGEYDLFIRVSDFTDSITNNSGSVITIQPAPINVVGIYFPSTPNVAFNEVVATFVDQNPYVSISDLLVTINWGDGGSVSAATALTQVGSSTTYQISGSHIYQSAGLKTITVQVSDTDSHNSATGMSFTGDRVFANGFELPGTSG